MITLSGKLFIVSGRGSATDGCNVVIVVQPLNSQTTRIDTCFKYL